MKFFVILALLAAPGIVKAANCKVFPMAQTASSFKGTSFPTFYDGGGVNYEFQAFDVIAKDRLGQTHKTTFYYGDVDTSGEVNLLNPEGQIVPARLSVKISVSKPAQKENGSFFQTFSGSAEVMDVFTGKPFALQVLKDVEWPADMNQGYFEFAIMPQGWRNLPVGATVGTHVFCQMTEGGLAMVGRPLP